MDKYAAGVVEQVARAFGCRLHATDEIGELFHVPAADVAHDPLAVRAIGSRRFAVAVGIVVVTRSSVPQPWETRQSLALREHVGCYARLTGGKRVNEEIALQAGDLRPVLHVAIGFRRIDSPVLARQS